MSMDTDCYHPDHLNLLLEKLLEVLLRFVLFFYFCLSSHVWYICSHCEQSTAGNVKMHRFLCASEMYPVKNLTADVELLSAGCRLGHCL